MPDDPISTTHASMVDKVVLAVCELLALVFALPFGKDLYHGVEVSPQHLRYLGIGVLFSISGFVGPLLVKTAWRAARRLLKGSQPSEDNLQYLSNEDAELGPAIMLMAWRSAEGRWYAAQCLANNPKGKPEHHEDNLMHWAGSRVWGDLVNGKLEARGRRRGQLGYEVIPATHWRSSPLHMKRDNKSLWKMILIPTGGAEFNADGEIVRTHDPASTERTNQLSAYDSFIVRARQFESVWPRKDDLADTQRKVLLKKAKKAGADPTEVQKLSDKPDGSRLWWHVGFIIGVGAVVILLYFGVRLYHAMVMPPQSPPISNQWERLTSEEAQNIHNELQNLPHEKLSVLCAFAGCTDLALSIFAVVHDDLKWDGNYEAMYWMDGGIKQGIEIWSYPQKATARKKIAEAIERATKGRLKISSHEWDQPPPPENVNDLNLIIGRVR